MVVSVKLSYLLYFRICNACLRFQTRDPEQPRRGRRLFPVAPVVSGLLGNPAAPLRLPWLVASSVRALVPPERGPGRRLAPAQRGPSRRERRPRGAARPPNYSRSRGSACGRSPVCRPPRTLRGRGRSGGPRRPRRLLFLPPGRHQLRGPRACPRRIPAELHWRGVHFP